MSYSNAEGPVAGGAGKKTRNGHTKASERREKDVRERRKGERSN